MVFSPRYENFPVSLVNSEHLYLLRLTGLYFTMTCLTSIGFGNVAAETDMEKVNTKSSLIIFTHENCKYQSNLPGQVFCLCMMIISSLLYAAIFGHVTTIIHNMTLAAAKYHDMLNNVREFMVLNEVTTWMSKTCLLHVRPLDIVQPPGAS